MSNPSSPSSEVQLLSSGNKNYSKFSCSRYMTTSILYHKWSSPSNGSSQLLSHLQMILRTSFSRSKILQAWSKGLSSHAQNPLNLHLSKLSSKMSWTPSRHYCATCSKSSREAVLPQPQVSSSKTSIISSNRYQKNLTANWPMSNCSCFLASTLKTIDEIITLN